MSWVEGPNRPAEVAFTSSGTYSRMDLHSFLTDALQWSLASIRSAARVNLGRKDRVTTGLVMPLNLSTDRTWLANA